MYPSLDIIGLTCAFIMIAKASNTIPNPRQDSSKDEVDDIFDQFSEEISRTQLRSVFLQRIRDNKLHVTIAWWSPNGRLVNFTTLGAEYCKAGTKLKNVAYIPFS